MESFLRMLEFDVAFSAYATRDDFLTSPVVQVAEAACRLLTPTLTHARSIRISLRAVEAHNW
jgi:hypothetical protein